MRQTDPIGLAKAVLWEEAKGKLRAMVAVQGACEGGAEGQDSRAHYDRVKAEIEMFIIRLENSGLHE